jgi:hypothetical protein
VNEQLHWLTTLISTLVQRGFYGEVTIQVQDGEVILARVGQTIKPRKPFKQMTGVEYRLRKEQEGLYGKEG